MTLFRRENYLRKIRPFYHEADIIKVITGVRRCGKSSLMQTIAEELMEQGSAPEQIVMIDLDKRDFQNIQTQSQLDELIAKACNGNEFTYLFIDEIQNVNGFESVINAYRTDDRYSIFITGSNSYLLSGELVTKLTGRYLEFELYPLTFEEYELMKKHYHKIISPNPMEELNNYVLEGGFPRTLLLDSIDAKRTYVQGIVREIFDKDIKKRVIIKDKNQFEIIKSFVINNFGATMSISHMCEMLQKQNIHIGRQTISKYINILIDAKILYECPRFDMKSKRALSGEKKYYIADLSFYFATNTDNQVHFGPVLENLVFFYAKSHDYSISVGRVGKLECDFILRSQSMNYAYVQVSYTIAISQQTQEREFKPLESIRDNYPKYLMTTDYLLQRRNGIHHVNLIEFMRAGLLF